MPLTSSSMAISKLPMISSSSMGATKANWTAAVPVSSAARRGSGVEDGMRYLAMRKLLS